LSRVDDSRPIKDEGLSAPIVADRVSDSVRLLVGLVAGFGSCTPVETIRDTLSRLGRADAHLVLCELSENHERVRRDVAVLYPELLSVLERKRS
jgi:hypothetical protein